MLSEKSYHRVTMHRTLACSTAAFLLQVCCSKHTSLHNSGLLLGMGISTALCTLKPSIIVRLYQLSNCSGIIGCSVQIAPACQTSGSGSNPLVAAMTGQGS